MLGTTHGDMLHNLICSILTDVRGVRGVWGVRGVGGARSDNVHGHGLESVGTV